MIGYKYQIAAINSNERWIMIVSNDRLVCEQQDSFLYFVKRIQKDIGGEIENKGDYQLTITGDPLGLIYKWDSCIGISVAFPVYINKEDVTLFLSKYMD